MPDNFTNVSAAGYANRIVGSFIGAILGLALFIGSFVLLYWNEGRVDISTIAKKAAEINSRNASPADSLNGALISTTGNITSDEMIGDGLYLKPGRYLTIERRREMFAWIEQTETKTSDNPGGTKTTETVIKYVKGWTGEPSLSSGFRHPEEHQNPQISLSGSSNTVRAARIGSFDFDPPQAALRPPARLALKDGIVDLKDGATLAGGFVFLRKSQDGTLNNPQIGDIRVSYYALASNFQGTIFGKLNGSRVEPYVDAKGDRLCHVFQGSRELAIANLHTEYSLLLWILRVAGFAMMWIGLALIFDPVTTLLDLVPVFGAIGKVVILFVTLITAIVRSTVAILVSMALHNIIAVAVAGALVFVGMIALLVSVKRKRQAAFAPGIVG